MQSLTSVYFFFYVLFSLPSHRATLLLAGGQTNSLAFFELFPTSSSSRTLVDLNSFSSLIYFVLLFDILLAPLDNCKPRSTSPNLYLYLNLSSCIIKPFLTYLLTYLFIYLLTYLLTYFLTQEICAQSSWFSAFVTITTFHMLPQFLYAIFPYVAFRLCCG